jgi:hypothetical protein
MASDHEYRPKERMMRKIVLVAAFLLTASSAMAKSQSVEIVTGNPPAAVSTSNPFPTEEQGVVHVIIEPQPGTDGSIQLQGNMHQTLFGGATPPNGFSVYGDPLHCTVNDNGLAGPPLNFGFPLPYTTPLGYKPMGPVDIYCVFTSGQITARMW